MSNHQALVMATLLGLVTGGLSGCMGDTPTETPDADRATDPAPTGSVDGALKAAAGTYEPWTLSDLWVFDMQVRGFERFTETKLAYYEERGPEYLVGTPSYDEALYHAIFSFNPILGRVHQGHLSPHEKGEHAEMYPFERAGGVIRDGTDWTTVFYEHGLDMTATFDPQIDTPLGPRPGYRVEGIDRFSDFRVTYDYVPEIKWFTDFKVVDEDGLRFHLQLKEASTGYSGPAHFIRAKDLLHETITSDGGLLRKQVEFEVTADHVASHRVEGFGISADIQMESGISSTLRLRDPDGNVIWEKRHDAPQSGEFNIEEVWPQGSPSDKPLGERPQWPKGTYTLEFDFNGRSTAEVHIVGTQDNSGRV